MVATQLAPAPSPATERSSRPGLLAVTLAALAIAGISIYSYAQGTLAEIAASDADAATIAGNYVGTPAFVQGALYLHIGAAALALALGPAQFSRRLRARAPRGHRITGRVYFVAVGLGALAALVIAPWNLAGLVGLFGFGSLGVLWLWTGARALRAIRAGDVALHQSWMLRNYALTFAAPMLRLWTGVLVAVLVATSGGDLDPEAAFANAYAAVPFLCWLPNLVVAEWLVRRRGLPSYRLTSASRRTPGYVVGR